MKEITLQNVFENFLISKRIPYDREVLHRFGEIDFKIELNKKICGVEVKSSKAKIATTIGQLVLAQMSFSHVYLLAPREFLKTIEKIIEKKLDNLGLISFENGGFIFLKHPGPDKYYFKPIKTRKKTSKKTKHIIIVDRDYFLLSKFQNKIFDSSTVAKELKITRVDAYNRIKRLLKVGLIEEVSQYNPKQFYVKKIVDWGTKFPLTQNKI